MILAIVGSRNGMDKDVFLFYMNYYLKKWGHPDEIISGGCRGVDEMAKKFAIKNKIPFREYLPDAFLGKGGFLKRNTEIANACSHCIAFPCRQSKGTWDTVRKVTALNKKIKIISIE